MSDVLERERELADRIAVLVRDLPDALVQALAERVAALPPGAKRKVRVAAAECIVPADARDRAAKLLARWADEAPDVPPVAVACALRAAAAADRYRREDQTVELVWTGPTPGGTTFRRTDQALLEVIESAREELLLVTFAAHYLKPVVKALIAATDRGVKLTCVFETHDASGGKVFTDPLETLGPVLAARAEIYVWPLEKREKGPDGKYGVLHVKCAVADRRLLFVSSANLTGAAMTRNMELGVLLAGGAAAPNVVSKFKQLAWDGVVSPMLPERQ